MCYATGHKPINNRLCAVKPLTSMYTNLWESCTLPAALNLAYCNEVYYFAHFSMAADGSLPLSCLHALDSIVPTISIWRHLFLEPTAVHFSHLLLSLLYLNKLSIMDSNIIIFYVSVVIISLAAPCVCGKVLYDMLTGNPPTDPFAEQWEYTPLSTLGEDEEGKEERELCPFAVLDLGYVYRKCRLLTSIRPEFRHIVVCSRYIQGNIQILTYIFRVAFVTLRSSILPLEEMWYCYWILRQENGY